MNKNKWFSLVLFGFFFFPLASAQSLESDETVSPAMLQLRQQNQEALNKAIQLRQKRYYNEKEETREMKNTYYRATSAAFARRQAHIKTSVDDALVREGELTDWGSERTFQEGNTYRPNSKQVFRRCVVNYYYEGGACTPEDLMQGLAVGSEHKVKTVQDVFWKNDVEALNDVRNLQRNLPSWRRVGAGQQGVMRNDRFGDTSREYLSPFTRPYYDPQD